MTQLDDGLRSTPGSTRRSLRWRCSIACLALSAALSCTSLPTTPVSTVQVTGRFSDRGGRPVSGVVISFRPGRQSLASHYDAQVDRSDSTGTYSVELVEGDWNVEYVASEGSGVEREYKTLRVHVSARASRFDFVFDGWRVGGRVLGPTGAPIDSGSVEAFGPAYVSTSFRSGAYSLVLPSGTYQIIAYPGGTAPGLPSGTLRGVAVLADTIIDIPIEGVPALGIVTGPDATPLGNCLVVADLAGTDTGYGLVRGRTDSSGRYLVYLPVASYRFRLYSGQSTGLIVPWLTDVETITGPTTLDFHLRGVRWSGTVLGPAGPTPLPGATVTAEMFGDVYRRGATDVTNPGGAFDLYLQPDREYDLTVTAAGAAPASILGLKAGSDTTFQVLLDPPPVP